MRRLIFSNRSSMAACGALAAGVTATLIFTAAAPAGAATSAPPFAAGTSATDPAVAADPQPVVVPFGDVFQATIGGPGNGFLLETGQAGLMYDSSLTAKTRIDWIGTGTGWSWGAYVDFSGATPEVYVPGSGVHGADPASKTGLDGGPLGVLFQQQPGELPAREGVVGVQHYVATLQHLSTGVTDYFDEQGNVIASIGPDGRVDRSFEVQQLTSMTDASGQSTSVTYPGLPRIAHADGTIANVVPSDEGQTSISDIQVFNADSTPRFLSRLAYGAHSDGVTRMASVTSIAPHTGLTLSSLGLVWAEGAPGGVVTAVLDDKVVYQR